MKIEALEWFRMIKQIESDRTANLCKLVHVGMLLQEVSVNEDTNPLYGNTMPEFVELEGADDSDDDNDNSLEIVEPSEIMEKRWH